MRGFLSSAEAADAGRVGGKAASLHRLRAAGFDAPDFLVLTDACFDETGSLVPEAAEALGPAAAALGPGPWAVRSSARAEDGAAASHAGQFLSRLDVAASQLAAAATEVRRSGAAAHVATYRAAQGVADASAPAVIVQPMIAARAAGVAFSADPASGLRGRAVIAAVEGLAEALVAGRIDGETWVIGPGEAAAPPGAPQVLGIAEARAIAALAAKAEAAFGAPQDIEWAIGPEGLQILQSRPITTPLRPAAAPDPALSVLDNSNIIESYPGLVSPLTFSFASYCYARVYPALTARLGVPQARIAAQRAVFSGLLVRAQGRVYYNLGHWYRMLAMLPAFSLNAAHMETMMGVSEPLPEELTAALRPAPARGLARASALAGLARVAGGLVVAAIRLPSMRRRYLARVEAALQGAPAPHGAGLVALAAEYRLIEAQLLDRWDAPLVNDLLCMIGFGASRALLGRWGGEEGLSLHNAAMIGQGGIVSAEPSRRIAEMGREAARDPGALDACEKAVQAPQDWRRALAPHPRLKAALEAYLARFGDRCVEELKLESLPLTEDPRPLLAAVQAAARAPQAPEREAPALDWSKIGPQARPLRPLGRAVARALTGWAAARVRDRENLRFERTRVFGRARRIFVAMGRELHAHGLLDDPRDVFLLTLPELLGAIEGGGTGDDLRALAAIRCAEAEAAAAAASPPARIALRGAVAVGLSLRAGRGAPAPAAPAAREARGLGCSAGTLRARARVMHDPRGGAVAPGDILVAPHTDPGWIAQFASAGALVVERGSLLSHSAIVAREMGIPCVVGLKGATDWIATGELIEVDGAAGTVRKCDG